LQSFCVLASSQGQTQHHRHSKPRPSIFARHMSSFVDKNLYGNQNNRMRVGWGDTAGNLARVMEFSESCKADKRGERRSEITRFAWFMNGSERMPRQLQAVRRPWQCLELRIPKCSSRPIRISKTGFSSKPLTIRPVRQSVSTAVLKLTFRTDGRVLAGA
jgi:hypothetical protein